MEWLKVKVIEGREVCKEWEVLREALLTYVRKMCGIRKRWDVGMLEREVSVGIGKLNH